MFITQVRGILSDCPLPALDIYRNNTKYRLSFDWKELFDQMFGERKLMMALLPNTQVRHTDSVIPHLYLI